MKFVNYTNFSQPAANKVSKQQLIEALLQWETKDVKKVNKMVEGLDEEVDFATATSLFTDKLKALSVLKLAEGKKKPGPDPYMTGLDDKTRKEKEEQMKKQAKMSDDDPAAYKEMPGSEEAREKGKVKTSKHTKSYHELYGDEEKNENLQEGVGTIALGIMLAYAGLKVLKFVAKKVVGAVGKNVKLEPVNLKKITMEMVKNVAKETGSGADLLLGIALKREIDAKIDSGEIKTIGGIQKAMEDYLKTNEAEITISKEDMEKLHSDGEVEIDGNIVKFEEGVAVTEADINDPVLMAFRAAKINREKRLAKPKRKPLYGKQREKAEDDLWQISQELKDLYADRGQLLIDMEQEAEVEGGPIADKYGDRLNRIEDQIQKLIAKRNRLEIRLAESFKKDLSWDALIEKINSIDINEAKMQEIDKKVQKFVVRNANDYDYSNQESAFQIYLSLRKLYPSLIESKVNEADFGKPNNGDYSDEMSFGQLEKCIDYSTMIRERIQQGTSLDPWMHSQIAVAENELNSVWDAVDGDDGVVEANELAQKIMNGLDAASQLHSDYHPKEVLDTVDGVLKNYRSLGGKKLERAAREIRMALLDTGNLANDSSDVDFIIMNSLNEDYTIDDINASYGFYGTIESSGDVDLARRAEELFDEGVLALQGSPYRLSEREAIAVLNSKMGRKAAEQIIDGQSDSALLGLEQYYGKEIKSEIKKAKRFKLNEDLRADLKKYIKSNKKELDRMADAENWDGINQMLINDFGLRDGSEEAEDLIQTFNFIY